MAAVGLLAVFLVGYPTGEPRFRVSRNELVNLPARWDAGWYLDMAQVGLPLGSRRAAASRTSRSFPRTLC